MHFDSIAAAAYMEGHGIYVWLAYAITVILLSWLMWSPARQFRKRKHWVIAEGQRRAASDKATVESIPQTAQAMAVNREPMETQG